MTVTDRLTGKADYTLMRIGKINEVGTGAQNPAHVAELLAVLGEPTRLRIANLLQAQPLCVCDLQSALGLSEPLVSRHLARLRFARLAKATRDGNRMVYRLSWSGSFADLALKRFLNDIRRHDPLLQQDLENCHGLLSAGQCPRKVGGHLQAPLLDAAGEEGTETAARTIEILGPGCVRCLAAEQNIRQALSNVRPQPRIVHVDDPAELARRGIKLTPAVVIDGTVKSSGRVPEFGEIRRWLKLTSSIRPRQLRSKARAGRQAMDRTVHAY